MTSDTGYMIWLCRTPRSCATQPRMSTTSPCYHVVESLAVVDGFGRFRLSLGNSNSMRTNSQESMFWVDGGGILYKNPHHPHQQLQVFNKFPQTNTLPTSCRDPRSFNLQFSTSTTMQIHRIFFSLALPLLVLGDIIPKNPLTGVGFPSLSICRLPRFQSLAEESRSHLLNAPWPNTVSSAAKFSQAIVLAKTAPVTTWPVISAIRTVFLTGKSLTAFNWLTNPHTYPHSCGFTCQAGSEACYKIGICSDGGNTGKVNWKSTDLDAQKYPCSKGCQSTCFGTTPADALTGGGSMSGGEFGIEDADG